MNAKEYEQELIRRVEAAQKLVDSANRALRAHRNNFDLNKKEPVWPTPEEAKRQGIVEHNGNTGEHYE
jgi:hypothetical protein